MTYDGYQNTSRALLLVRRAIIDEGDKRNFCLHIAECALKELMGNDEPCITCGAPIPRNSNPECESCQ